MNGDPKFYKIHLSQKQKDLVRKLKNTKSQTIIRCIESNKIWLDGKNNIEMTYDEFSFLRFSKFIEIKRKFRLPLREKFDAYRLNEEQIRRIEWV